MSEQFLYQELDVLSRHGVLSREMPDSITQNLHPKFELRPLSSGGVCKISPLLKWEFPRQEKSVTTLV